MPTQITKIQVRNLPIRLGQFLKLAGLVQDGFEAKQKIQSGEVKVNGYTETKRGKQLKQLDNITISGKTWLVQLAN